MLVSRNGSHSHSTLPLQDHPPLQKDSIVTGTARETENIATEIEILITGTLVTVTTRRIIVMPTEILVAVVVVVGIRGRLSLLPPRLVTTPTLVGLVAVVDDTNTIATGIETMIVETGMGVIAVGGGARTAIATTLPLAMCTIPRGNTRRGEGGTVVVVAMAIAAGRREEEDMEAIEVVGVAVGVVTEEETGADSLSLEVSGVYLASTTMGHLHFSTFIYKLANILFKFQGTTNYVSLKEFQKICQCTICSRDDLRWVV